MTERTKEILEGIATIFVGTPIALAFCVFIGALLDSWSVG